MSNVEASSDGYISVSRDYWSTSDRIKDVHWVGGLRSQLKCGFWNYELAKEENQELQDYLSTGVMEGFRVIDKHAPVKSYFCENYNSVLYGESTEYINDFIYRRLS